MACGDRYRHLIRTSSGYTADDRCGYVCLRPDVMAWGDAARALGGRVNLAWKELIRVETGPGDIVGCAADECPSATIQPELDGFFEEVDDAPDLWSVYFTEIAWTPGTARSKVDKTVAVMEKGVCILDQIQTGIADVGGVPLSVPAVPTKEPEKASFWDNFVAAVVGTGLIIGTGAVIYYGIKARRKAKASEELASAA